MTISLADTWSSIFAPADRRPIYEWAADHIRLGNAYTITGGFNVELSRHLKEPLDALKNDRIKVVAVRAPVRSGKTLLADVWLPWVIANDPGPFMWNMQSDPIAKDHAEIRVMPNLQECEPVARLFDSANRHKTRTQEIIFSNGMPLYIQGPSLGNLQSKGIRYQVNDEVWMWDPGRLAQAMARTGDFDEMGNSKILLLSQGGIEDDDEDAEWKKGTRAEWMVPCLSCGHYQPADMREQRPDGSYGGLVFDEGGNARDGGGFLLPGVCIASVRFECMQCRHPHTDEKRTRAEWNRLGKYEPQNPHPQPNYASFHYGNPICRSWPALAEEMVHALNAHARGVIEPMIVFTQKRKARPWSELELLAVKSGKTHSVVSDWPDEVARLMTVDVQRGGVFWCQIRAWSKTGQTRRLWFGRLHGVDAVLAKQDEFKVPSNRVLIDSGDQTKTVYSWCVQHGWVALKGEDKKMFIHRMRDRAGRLVQVQRSYSVPIKGDPEAGLSTQGQRFATVILFCSPVHQDRLERLIESGQWQEPEVDAKDEAELEYRRQMRAEYRKQVRDKITGRMLQQWVCPSGNNHLRDCAKMQVVGATLLRLIPDREMEEPVEQGEDS